MKITAYVSGALTGGDEIELLKHFYERIAETCKRAGIDAYVPHDRRISRMARGNPAVVAEIHFTDQDDALHQLSHWLKEWKA